MSYSALPSAEVAQDFREALEDLKINSRPEISNLTVIAKENTEYAQAISRELEDHIRKTRPEFKLPALYVLDSIVKNVGTPYTVYLGRNLYSTFMGAYTLVDPNVRKAMEALLKTWKQPVPESLDTRPVFPSDVTRDIENALIKARTVMLQHQQQQARPHKLYEARPDQCRQCGRRFPATEEGKRKKAAHMDWHFAVNTRVAESAKAVVNRSWYIGEREWIAYREVTSDNMNDSTNSEDGTGSANGTPSKAKKAKKESVVPVPTDVSQQNAHCPICQEKFDVSWHEEMQMPVWTNAMKVGGRVYHKTCYEEAGSARNTPTPESVLGKRKFDGGVEV
ncbi:hypothetical protein NA57DRAFT_41406 [Rhizodiscina lignyota]|uniref:CID domain-containing protein n=1 Tax=Rhizodiscina lignyota TaxID=1504668 RepID=A0A9P4M541_9PEZI|nr:hypothetical protein NA57DRAFT_41406 [Rhizodiscina lignyota]